VALPAEGELALPEWGIVVAVRMEAGRGGRPRGPGEDPHEAAFDIDRLPGMLGVRSRRPGDRFHPEGMMGRKRLQDFFVDTRVPRWRRDRVPLLVAGGDVLWVIGVRRDRRYLASGTGRTVVVRVRHDTPFHPHRAPAGREVGSAARQSSSETT
jgi:tRNA(Ile)-lysidine synthase